jgi:hypothetical protein
MKKTRNILFVIMIALVSFACLSSAKTKNKNELGIDKGKIEADASTSEEMSSGNQSDNMTEYVYDEGGFKFSPIPDWEVTCAIGIIQMRAPDADPDFGPVFMIMAGDNNEEMTNEEAFDKYKSSSTDAEIGKAKKIKVGGFQGLQSDLTSHQGETEIRAIAVTSMLTPFRQFTMMASSPADRWDKEVVPYFDDVLSSIKFINIVPDAGCPGSDEANIPQAAPEGSNEKPGSVSSGEVEQIRQWASSARASSEYGEVSWSASQATGAPDVPNCEDNSSAWASLGSDTKEWIELSYDIPVVPTEIAIYTSYNPSQVTEVDIIDVDGNEYVARETSPQVVEFCPDLYQIFLELDKNVYVKKVKIYIDQGQLDLGWSEIDAVELIGYPEGGSAFANQPTQPQNPGGQSTEGTVSPYAPQDLDPGSYAYDVSGYENDVVMGANVQYQSIESTYVVGLISGTERYIVNLMLPKDKLKKGHIQMAPYSTSGNQKDLTAAIYINAFLYIADSGEYNFATDPATGKITGTFYFKAQSKDFPDRFVEVSGAVNSVLLK